ncbi:DinB family protein [Peribacillus deserti]|uniref:DinB family protein n=1 Tax=Peribacillus deserti TaxID=673318 RepID=A0A2N5M077_9BACI|nr:DinB family protein [Peribacillus deserti]PLT27751.1 DinB family protein [Peribacillus deserti]
MAELKEILLNELEVCQSKIEMFSGMNNSLKGLNAIQASWRDGGGENSIWDIVNHLIFWNERFLHQFMGLPVSKESFSNDSTFFKEKNPALLNEEQWEAAVARLNSVFNEWKEAIHECDEEMLLTPPSPERPWWKTVSSMNLHTAHHIGQIIFIRKRQGSWEPVKWD